VSPLADAATYRRREWLWRALTVVVVVIVAGGAGVVIVRQHRADEASSAAAHCGAYKSALAAALTVPDPGGAAPATGDLSASDQITISRSRSAFLSQVDTQAHDAYRGAQSRYQAQLDQGPYAAGPPTPPSPLASYEAAAVSQATASWQQWAIGAEKQMLSRHGCS